MTMTVPASGRSRDHQRMHFESAVTGLRDPAGGYRTARTYRRHTRTARLYSATTKGCPRTICTKTFTKDGKRVMAPARSGRSTATDGETAEGADDEAVGSAAAGRGDELFCVCRRPDDHRWMIACDGGCNDWYHGECIDLTEQQGGLIDKYICPKCEFEGKKSLWKPLCRVDGCDDPARVGPGHSRPSKYCSDEHGRQFFQDKLTAAPDLRAQDLTYASSVLAKGVVAALANPISCARDFHELGQRISPSAAGREARADREAGISGVGQVDPNRQPQQSVVAVNQDDGEDCFYQRHKHRALRGSLMQHERTLDRRTKFLEMTIETAIKLPQDICGFDQRLARSDEEFEAWLRTEEARPMLEGARAAQTDGPTEGVCQRRRCDRHRDWRRLHISDLGQERTQVLTEMARLHAKQRELDERWAIRHTERSLNDDGAQGRVETVGGH